MRSANLSRGQKLQGAELITQRSLKRVGLVSGRQSLTTSLQLRDLQTDLGATEGDAIGVRIRLVLYDRSRQRRRPPTNPPIQKRAGRPIAYSKCAHRTPGRAAVRDQIGPRDQIFGCPIAILFNAK